VFSFSPFLATFYLKIETENQKKQKQNKKLFVFLTLFIMLMKINDEKIVVEFIITRNFSFS